MGWCVIRECDMGVWYGRVCDRVEEGGEEWDVSPARYVLISGP